MSVGKYIQYGFYVIINDSVYWGVNRGVGAEVVRVIDGELYISKV